MAVLTPKQLGQAAITVSATPVYTVPANTVGVIQSIDIVNTASATRTVRVHIVPSGGSVSTANALIYDMSIAASGELSYAGPLMIEAAGFISVLASDTGLTITVSGFEHV